jgi:hypothetical protein
MKIIEKKKQGMIQIEPCCILSFLNAMRKLTTPDSFSDTEVALISFVPTAIKVTSDPQSSNPETKNIMRIVVGREGWTQYLTQVLK